MHLGLSSHSVLSFLSFLFFCFGHFAEIIEMDFLKAEILKKKKEVEEVKGKKRWVKNGELKNATYEKIREEEKKEMEKKNLEKLRKRQRELNLKETKVEEEESEKKSKVNLQTVKVTLPKEEVFKRLRVLEEPITLFGETEEARYSRMLILETESNLKKSLMPGMVNDLGNAMREMEEEDLKETGDRGDTNIKTEDPIFQVTADEATRIFDTFNPEVHTKPLFILHFFKCLLRLREKEVAQIPKEFKRTGKGKFEVAQYKQTKGYIMPLLHMLEENKLDDFILEGIFKIVEFMKQREYMQAYHEYMAIAIGNAAWPMGVTQVSIHSRTGREKLNTSEVAHVLNDETQRKYIQAIKRLMTLCQAYYPTDPSKMVN
eukprot:GCRY01001520.1.p1 GENE.GCRY01001520.1~~GCRY01001520.1.p1  ORF type:complete len:374 (-),score=96.27 GCRY01001520.1:437-1558(-)